MTDDDAAEGWDAINGAFAHRYPGQEPRHWAMATKLPGDPGIDGLSAYDAGDHWHFVTLGLTELWFKETDDPTVSGFGYEFTMRVRHAGEEPPGWVLNILQRLGDAVFSGRRFGPGHTLDPGGPITGEPSSNLRALLFVDDPEFPALATPHGRVEFLQVVGITAADLEAIKRDRAAVEFLGERNPLYVTDPHA